MPHTNGLMNAATWDAAGNTISPSPTGKRLPYILAQGGVPIGIAPTGTMAANGAVTLGTALNATYSGGIWFYYPSEAVYAGSAAGFYWTVMSSTTAGTVYDTTYTPGTGSFDIPASPTPISAAGPGAFTGVTNETTLVSATLPGGALGNHGGLLHTYRDTRSNSANAKTIRAKLGGTVSVLNSSVTSQQTASFSATLRNMGRQNKQSTVAGVSDSSGGTTNAAVFLTIDTSVAQYVVYTIQLAVATDYAIMLGFSFQVQPS